MSVSRHIHMESYCRFPLLAVLSALHSVPHIDMLRASRSALAAAKETTKLSTGITGLVVDPNWRQTLTQLYEKTLKDVQVRWEHVCRAGMPHQSTAQIMPEDIHYRQTVEATAKHRLQCIQSMGVRQLC